MNLAEILSKVTFLILFYFLVQLFPEFLHYL